MVIDLLSAVAEYFFFVCRPFPCTRTILEMAIITSRLTALLYTEKEAYCPPNAVQNPMLDRHTKSVFTFCCRLSVPSLGRPNCLKPTVPRTPFKIPCWIGAQNQFFLIVCRRSVPSLGRPNCLKPTVPRTPFKIQMLDGRTTSVF